MNKQVSACKACPCMLTQRVPLMRHRQDRTEELGASDQGKGRGLMFDHGRVKAPRRQAPVRETSRTSVPPAAHAGAAPSRDEMPPGSPAPFDFSRISIVPVDDPGERVAEQTADQVLHMRPSPAAPPEHSWNPASASISATCACTPEAKRRPPRERWALGPTPSADTWSSAKASTLLPLRP